jgi:hypothetical protein
MKPELHYCFHKSLPLGLSLIQMNSVKFPHNFPKIHPSIIIHFMLGFPNGLFPSGLPTKILYSLIFFFWSMPSFREATVLP